MSVKTVFDMVLEFSRSFGAHIGSRPELPPQNILDLRKALVIEEWNELMAAIDRNDLVGVADALGDINYVVQGFAIACGIDLDAVTEEIHTSNMTKLGGDGKPLYRDDGKVLKGPDYRPPNLSKIIANMKPL